MGYMHYWTIHDITKPLMTSEIAQDIQKIILASDVPIGDGCGAWDSKPVLEHDQVVLNGIDDDGHDTLWYPPVFEGRRKLPPVFEGHRKLPPEPLGRDFCKTAQKPYDVVVCAALLAIKHHQGDNVEIHSDGKFDDEWQPAYQLYRKATGRELPPEFREYEDQDELLTTDTVEPREDPRATRSRNRRQRP